MSNHFRTTLRQLWRNYPITLLNVVGLAVGIAAAWVIYQYASFEFSYDAQHPQRERVFRVVSRSTINGEESGNAGAPRPLAAATSGLAGVQLAVPVLETGVKSVQPGPPGQGGARYEEAEHMVLTTGQYFQLAPYQWLAGSPAGALAQPDQVVLTRSRAARYFPGLAPDQVLGQTLTYNDTSLTRISGVVADLDYPSSFAGQEFRPVSPAKMTDKYWTTLNSSEQLYLLLAENVAPPTVETQINQLTEAKIGADLAKHGMRRAHVLQPLAELHFDADYASTLRTANKKVLFGLMGIAGFLLLLACINYVNLATAQIPQRSREIGIRKTLGSSRGRILGHFLGETALVASCAVLLAGGLTAAFFHAFGDLLPDDVLRYVHYGPTALFLAGLVIVVSLLAGLYPGWLITRAQPVQALRGQLDPDAGSGQRVQLRKSLIVFQFAIAQLFIAGAIIVGQQLHFMYHQDLGFNRDAVVLLDIPWKVLENPANKDKHFTLLGELQKLPGVAQAAMGQPLLSNGSSSSTLVFQNDQGEEVKRTVFRKYADPQLLPLYKVPLLAGRHLLPSDTLREYVLNETAVRAFGFASPQAAVGQLLRGPDNTRLPIVGVVGDFHIASFAEKIEPLALMNEREGLTTFHVKLASGRPADWPAALHSIEAAWKQFYPAVPFKYEFYDDTLQQLYEAEANMARIVNLATGIALFISCLGLFGLATFLAQRRTKEIGIRKVLGASVASVVQLLSREFLVLVLVAFVLAVPVVYFLLNKWLAAYAYRIEIQWWVLAGTGVLAVAIAFLTVSFQSVRAALANPVKSLRSE